MKVVTIKFTAKNDKAMKIFVLGSTGMLGRYVSTYLKSQGHDVINVTRDQIDARNVKEAELRAILFHMGLKQGDVIINCIGMIKQKKEVTDLEFILVNSVFPRILANVCESEKAKLIHITTDCVFSGLRGLYNEEDTHDPTDMYGKSKSFGEPSNCTVIRTSIIGEELKGKLSLIEWVKSMKNKTVDGYTNHHWNGLTCLQLAKVFEDIIVNNKYWTGVRHIFSNTLTKAELVNTICWIYGLNVTVNPMETSIKCDRTLSTIYNDRQYLMSNIVLPIPNLETQIIEQLDFYSILSKKD